jgi:hypothetical protein
MSTVIRVCGNTSGSNNNNTVKFAINLLQGVIH